MRQIQAQESPASVSAALYIRTPAAVAEKYGCSLDAARIYCDLREEGYRMHQAELMAGLTDPHDAHERRPIAKATGAQS